jgi:hypothetical protein
MDLGTLKAALSAGRVIITQHADREAKAEFLNLTEVRASVITGGEIIEDYPTDRRGPSCLVLSMLPGGKPVHSCWGYQAAIGFATLITIYRPDLQPQKWNLDWRKRAGVP